MRTVLAVILATAVALSAGPAAADDELNETARAAIAAFVNAVIAGPEALEPILAPEFQILRANGVGYDREGYLGTGAETAALQPGFTAEDIVATAHDGVLVARYVLRIDGMIDGQPMPQRAPRLSVFRQIDGQWKVVAHANFGAVN
jgi:ketosteroid isomerase-like protein